MQSVCSKIIPTLRVASVSCNPIIACDTAHAIAVPSLRSFSDAPKQRQSKVKKKAKGSDSKPVETERSRDLDLVIKALDAPSTFEPPISAAEAQRRLVIGTAYVKGRFQQHNDLHHDLQCKIEMKKHAIKMLPRHSKLKEEALKVDDTGPPLWRHLPVWTPPIPNFDPSNFAKREE